MGLSMADNMDILDSAADWHARLEGDDPDYEAFAVWLECDERHRLAYDRVLTMDLLVSDNAAQLARQLPANDDVAAPRRWKLAGMAAAIAVAAGLGINFLPTRDDQALEIATTSGTRQIQLAQATVVTLDRDSRISYSRDNPRSVAVTRGSAHFAVRHDNDHPFHVQAGDYEIRDLGTKFTVSNQAGHLSVAVSEGLVNVRGPDLATLSVRPGERIDIADGQAMRSKVDAQNVGSWRSGRLVYNDTPLYLVIADINRYAAKPVRLDPRYAEQRFTGVMTIGDGSNLGETLAKFMGLPFERTASETILGAVSSQ